MVFWFIQTCGNKVLVNSGGYYLCFLGGLNYHFHAPFSQSGGFQSSESIVLRIHPLLPMW